MKKVTLVGVPEKNLSAVLEVLADMHIAVMEEAPITVTFQQGELISLTGSSNNIIVTYRKENELFRALSHLPSFLKQGKWATEGKEVNFLCYMADNSRGAVYNVETAKKVIRKLALAGFTALMLYTEDTYEIPGRPGFGHMRGRFSEQELKAIDDYAFQFGMEVIPCIQTLAHLSCALRWPEFNGYRDTSDILMVGEEKTYAFIRDAISQCARVFRSRKIHLGMDEAHELGRGAYLSVNGYRPQHEIMLEHLQKVVSICKEYELSPMMWDDMFFRMAFNGVYRVKEGTVPKEITDKIPPEVDLVYWDYYTRDIDVFSHMLTLHSELKNKTVFAGGAWCWSGFGTHNAFSIESSRMQLEQCEKFGIKDVIVTAWGDNGAEASRFSTFASIIYFAEKIYNGEEPSQDLLNRRAKDLFNVTFTTLLAFDTPDRLPETTPDKVAGPRNPSKYLLYNDPLERLLDCHFNPATAPNAYRENARTLRRVMHRSGELKYALVTLQQLCKVLSVKSDLGVRLYDAYKNENKKALAKCALQCGKLSNEVAKLLVIFRKQWSIENKPFGFSIHERRLAGLSERLSSVKARIVQYLMGKVDSIPELELAPIPIISSPVGEYIHYIGYNRTVDVFM